MALAQPPRINWRAPANCGTPEELGVAVVKLLREGATIPPSISFDGHIEPTPDQHWRLTLRAVSPSGNWTRQLVGAACSELRDAATVMIALAIDPNPVEGAPLSMRAGQDQAASPATNDNPASVNDSSEVALEAPPSMPAATPPTPAPTLNTSVPQPDTRRAFRAEQPLGDHGERRYPRFSVTGRAGLANGILPESTLALFLGAAPTWNRFRVSGELGWLRPQTRYATWSAERGARIAAWAASANGSYVHRFSRSELSIGGGLLGGYLSGQGVGAAKDSTLKGAVWVAAAARLGAALTITRDLSLLATTDAWYLLGAPRFKLRASDEGLIFEPSKVGGLFALGVAVRLW